MKRASAMSVVLIVVVLAGLGWLAKSLLLGDAPANEPGRAPAESSRPNEAEMPSPAVQSPSAAASPSREEVVADAPRTAPAPTDADGAPGSIVGRVLNPMNEPVPAAEVELLRGPAMAAQLAALTTPTGIIVQTDSAGRYRLKPVGPNDDYIIKASHAEFGDCNLSQIVVTAGQETQAADIKLRVGVHIEGVVTCSSRPVEGATVTLGNAMDKIKRFNLSNLKVSAKELDLEPVELKMLTDAAGHYEFTSVNFDTFEIAAEYQGLSRISKTSQTNLFGASSKDYRFDFELTPEARITGRVVDADKRGIGEATVKATIAVQGIRCDAQTITDASGSFTLKSLAAGNYFLQAEREGFTPATKNQVEAGASDVEIPLLVQGSVSGVVVDEETGTPIAAFELSVLQSYKGRGPATTRDDVPFKDPGGRFELKNLDPGRYAIQASAENYADSTSDEFEVVRGQLTPGIRVAVNRGGTITGLVVDSSGTPVKRAMVSVRENKMKDNPIIGIFDGLGGGRDRTRQIRTAEDGSFTLELIVPDTYQVLVRHNKYAQLEVNDIEVAKSQVRQLGKVVLPQGGKVNGHALDLTGGALNGALIAAVSKAQDYRQARANNDGYFEFAGLPAGEYTFTINNYQSSPPINPLQQLVYARNSAQKRQVIDGDELTVDLRLSDVDPNPKEPRPKKGK